MKTPSESFWWGKVLIILSLKWVRAFQSSRFWWKPITKYLNSCFKRWVRVFSQRRCQRVSKARSFTDSSDRLTQGKALLYPGKSGRFLANCKVNYGSDCRSKAVTNRYITHVLVFIFIFFLAKSTKLQPKCTD